MSSQANLQKGIESLLTSLTFPIMILNAFGGLIAGIWLILLGEWGLIFLGIFLILISSFVVSIALLPNLLIAGPAALAFNGGNKGLGIFFGSLSIIYTIILITYWCIWVLWLFVSSATTVSLMPLLIWSYGVALAPWVYLAQKDQQAGENDFSLASVFFAEVAYIISILLLLFGATMWTIIIIFGVIMLVGESIQLYFTFGGEIKKYFSDHEVKEAIKILDEVDNKLKKDSFKLVKKHVQDSIISDPQQFLGVVRNGRSVRKYVFSQIANVSGDLVESGHYHIYRGVLNPIGPGEDLLDIFDLATDELFKLGDCDKKFASKQKKNIRKIIQEMG